MTCYQMPCLHVDRSRPYSRYFLLSYCFENMTSNKQTRGFSRVVHVFAIPAQVAGEVSLLSEKVIKLIQSNLIGHFEKKGSTVEPR